MKDSPDMSKFGVFLYGTGLFCLALALRLPLLFRGFAEDELFMVTYAVRRPSIWDTISSASVFNNHIGYSLCARLMDSLFGGGEWSLRLPALLFGILGIFAVWRFSSYLLNSRAALLPAVLLSFAPIHIVYSASVRGYSAMVLFTVVSTHAYLLLRERWSLPRWFVFVAASVL